MLPSFETHIDDEIKANNLQFTKSLVTEWIPSTAIEAFLTYLYQIGPTTPRVLHEI